MIDVKDRIPTQPNRKKITYDDGRVEYAKVEYADNPTEVGTPINKVLFDSIGQDINSHKNNKSNPHGTTAAQTGAAVTKTFQSTIPTSGWSSSAPYTMTISVSGITSSDNPIIDVVLPDNSANSTLVLISWSYVSRIVTINDGITVYCFDKKPTVQIPIQIKVVR